MLFGQGSILAKSFLLIYLGKVRKNIESLTTPCLDPPLPSLPYVINLGDFFFTFWLLFGYIQTCLRPRPEYFQNVCDHFIIPASEVRETVQLVFGKELITIHSLSEAGREIMFVWGFLKTCKEF